MRTTITLRNSYLRAHNKLEVMRNGGAAGTKRSEALIWRAAAAAAADIQEPLLTPHCYSSSSRWAAFVQYNRQLNARGGRRKLAEDPATDQATPKTAAVGSLDGVRNKPFG